jgi:hypothetical protein
MIQKFKTIPFDKTNKKKMMEGLRPQWWIVKASSKRQNKDIRI